MSASKSPATGLIYGLKRVCQVWGISRSAVYYKRSRSKRPATGKRGPIPKESDTDLLTMIHKTLDSSPFSGEGHRKVWARLRRNYGIRVGRNRILKLMRNAKILSPHRSVRGRAKVHDGKIVTEEPNDMWATDAVKIFTQEDGWVWYFGVTDHWNSECLGWHVAKRGDRYAAMEALREAVRNGCGAVGKGVARGISLRPDHGSVFTAEAYRNEAKYLGFGFSYALVGEPETNGVEERFHRTMKEQCIHGRVFRNIEELREAIGVFIEDYNNEWLLAKLGYCSPREARQKWGLQNTA